MRTIDQINSQIESNTKAAAKVAKAEKIWAEEITKSMKNGTKSRNIAEIFASLEVA